MVHKQQMAIVSQHGDPSLLAQMAAASAPAPPPLDKPFLHSQAKVEDVAPVDARLRARALRPPVTIKSFFKPKPAASAGADADDADTSEDLTKPGTGCQPQQQQPRDASSSQSSQGAGKRGGVDAERAESEAGRDEIDGITLDQSDAASKPDVKEKQKDVSDRSSSDSSRKVTVKKKEGEGGTQKEEESENENEVNCSNKTADVAKLDKADSDATSGLPAASKGRKRKSSKAPLQPKAKQAKSAPSVKSGSKGQEGQPKRCPICDKKFDAGTWNDEINAHIDNCLIE